MDFMTGLKRTHYCGDLRVTDAGKEVVVAGWVQRQRDLGALIFIDLRDRTGIVQLAFDDNTDREIFEKAFTARSEFVLMAKGVVRERSSKNTEIPTGEIEIEVTDLRVLNKSETPPFDIVAGCQTSELTRLKHRYLDLRRPDLQSNIILRHKIAKVTRDYFDENGLPKQMDGNIQVLAADLQLNITTPWLNLDNSIVYQHSSSAALPLPTLTMYNNLYYHGTWVKALDVQIGVDMRLFTKYYAPILNPALGQFCIQDKEQVGNYPVMNVYANFYVKHIRLKLFAQYQHFNASFMNKQYFGMPHYPMAPDMFRAGLSWHFYK